MSPSAQSMRMKLERMWGSVIEPRIWLHSTLSGYAPLMAIIQSVLQGQSLLTADIPKPYLVHRFGNETDENLAEVDVYPRKMYFQVYVHDIPGDYIRIDSLVELVKAAFRSQTIASAAVAGVHHIRYLETSRDLSDPELGTIFRYIRFQMHKN